MLSDGIAGWVAMEMHRKRPSQLDLSHLAKKINQKKNITTISLRSWEDEVDVNYAQISQGFEEWYSKPRCHPTISVQNSNPHVMSLTSFTHQRTPLRKRLHVHTHSLTHTHT